MSTKTKPNPQAEGQLRQDPLTEKWVIVATDRAKRPTDFASGYPKTSLNTPQYKDDCPFCNLSKYPQEPDILRLPNDPDHWQVHIFANKYPALTPNSEFKTWNVGPHKTASAVGYHELLATVHHNQTDNYASEKNLALQLEALAMRYRQLRTLDSVVYIQIIKNHGSDAGGSLEHPHHQIFTTPVLPSDVADLLCGVEKYAKTHQTDPFQAIIDFEISDGSRLVYQNDDFIAFCPYASRQPFEVHIMPKKPLSKFDLITPDQLRSLAQSLKQVIGRLNQGVGNIPYNYYINSAPCDTTGFICAADSFPNFRWHLVILPRLNELGGFEMGTGLEITTAIPEASATFLREQKVA